MKKWFGKLMILGILLGILGFGVFYLHGDVVKYSGEVSAHNNMWACDCSEGGNDCQCWIIVKK